MKMFDRVFRRKKSSAVTKKTIKNKYKITSGFETSQRPSVSSLEARQTEEDILNNRDKLTAVARDAFRNSATLAGFLKQLQLNTIGVNGGKVILNFSDAKLADKILKSFSEYTRGCGFFGGENIKAILSQILYEYTLGGDCVILFDRNNLIENSGRLLIFGTDQIANLDDDSIIKARYGKNATQRNGIISNGNGREIGVIVSIAETGKDTFSYDKSFLLKKNPNDKQLDCVWYRPKNIFRAGNSQVRGITPLAGVLTSIQDARYLMDSELEAARLNAQTFAQIYNTGNTAEDISIPSAFDSDDIDSMSDDEIQNAVNETKETVVALRKAKASGVNFELMPDGYKMESIPTNHPNPNAINFLQFIQSQCGLPLSLASMYCNGNVTGADYKAQMMFSINQFRDIQKNLLEPIMDWVLYNFIQHLISTGEINKSDIDNEGDLITKIDWEWSRPDQIDEESYQKALQLKIANLTSSYKDIYGYNWRNKLKEIAEEKQYLRELNLVDISRNMISGGEKEIYTYNEDMK